MHFEPFVQTTTTGKVPQVSPDSSFYTSGQKSAKPSPKTVSVPVGLPVTAAAYLVGDVSTGRVYLEKNSQTILPVASMSKLITAFAATDVLPLSTMITITEAEMNVASDTSRLSAGERFTVRELLYPLLLNSSNVAAEALASTTDRLKFLGRMSSYAWEVSMP